MHISINEANTFERCGDLSFGVERTLCWICYQHKQWNIIRTIQTNEQQITIITKQNQVFKENLKKIIENKLQNWNKISKRKIMQNSMVVLSIWFYYISFVTVNSEHQALTFVEWRLPTASAEISIASNDI